MVTYGGDEVNALVLDMGTSWTRAGYAGEDTPKAIFPTWVGYSEEDVEMAEPVGPEDDVRMADVSANGDPAGVAAAAIPAPALPGKRKKYYIGDGEVNVWRPHMEVVNPLKDGLVEDWDAIEHIWNYAFHTRLRVDPTEHPLLCTEPAWNLRENREKMVELAFEKYGFPAFYLAKDAVMTAFAAGRATALVLDSGGGTTSAVPVYDGYVLKKGILRQPLGGDFISEQIIEQFQRDFNITVTPQYLVAKKNFVDVGQLPDVKLRDRPGTTESYHHYQQMRVIQEYKESVCQVSEMYYDEAAVAVRPQKPFEFPDGYNYNFGAERYRVPEIMFQPQQFMVKPEVPSPSYPPQLDNAMGVQHLIFNSVVSCDIDLRPLLFNNVVVTGGNTLWQGFTERLNFDLLQLAPGSKMKIHAAGNQTERKCSSWLGGSILSSLGTFHQLWVSKKEYEEIGASIVEKKCL
ncbi:actin family [Endogone sp. FLAS-F59071]|nr:actin family [Endogone sp. FLAS-F59071]|eukprot:RUS22056.1 actin family [Endogone sp. FLAS-F59071]